MSERNRLERDRWEANGMDDIEQSDDAIVAYEVPDEWLEWCRRSRREDMTETLVQ
jgi:hypothetical protein